MYKLWNENEPFPKYSDMAHIDGIRYVNVHTAIEGEYQFLLGCAITEYKDCLYASWANSFRMENDNNTILSQKKSEDGGETWTDYKRISDVDEGFGRSHGVYLNYKNRLYTFCPKARFDRVDSYPDLKTEGYVMDESGEFQNIGIVLPADFWPMCEPLVLENGKLIMAGLETDNARAAVALCDGEDLTKWEMKVLPNSKNYIQWGETTLLKTDEKLLAIIRAEHMENRALISESTDNGEAWSDIDETNFVIANSKMYAGRLSNGKNYLIFSAKGEGDDPNSRENLCIAVGNECFDKVYSIRHGFDAPPRFWMNNEWCYPYAYEYKENLYVIYAKNKEDCELAIIPVDSLQEL